MSNGEHSAGRDYPEDREAYRQLVAQYDGVIAGMISGSTDKRLRGEDPRWFCLLCEKDLRAACLRLGADSIVFHLTVHVNAAMDKVLTKARKATRDFDAVWNYDLALAVEKFDSVTAYHEVYRRLF